MAPLTFLPANTSARQMSQRIPPETWNKHKAEIVQAYRLGGKQGVARALQWILEQQFLGFSPTRRQLERQLKEVWQVDVVEEPSTSAHSDGAIMNFNDDGGLLGCPDGDALTPSITTDSDASTSPKGPGDTSSPYSATSQSGLSSTGSHRGKRKATSMNHPMELSQKRKKEAGSDQEDKMNSTFSPPQFTFMLEVTASVVGETTVERSSDEKIIHGMSEDVPTNPGATADVISEPKPLIDPQRLLTILEDIGVAASQSQVCQLLTGSFVLPPFAVEELRRIKEAADFLASGSRETAFPLYLTSRLIQNDSPPLSDGRIKALFSCAYAASSTEDLEVVRDLLIQEISGMVDLSSNKLNQFLLRLTLTETFQRLDCMSEYKDQLWMATRIFYDLDTFRFYVGDGNVNPKGTGLDLASYYIIDFAFRFLDDSGKRLRQIMDHPTWSIWMGRLLDEYHDASLKILASDFIHQSPGPFGLEDGALTNRCIRDCLKWCLEQLRPAFWLPRSWDILHHQLISKKWADSLGIYWFLWTQWNQPRSKLRHYDEFPNVWTNDTEEIMGISGPELLSEMASLMLEASPSEEKRSRIDRRFIPRDRLLVQRAVKGAKVLDALTDQQLAERFLSHLIDRNRQLYQDVRFQSRGSFGPSPKERNQAAIKVFVDTMRDSSTQRQYIDSVSGTRSSIMSAPSFNYTLASSYSSSTLSSMRRLAVHISRQSRLSRTSLESSWTRRTPSIDELSDRMSVLTLPALLPE